MTAWYNEPDPFKAAVIREAVKAGAVADGVVDERSIKDVRAADLVGFTQCHFFAGGGFWSLALRNAGWPDDRPVWTGSCPCPSFSAASKGGGFDDPRHLWPDWEKLIRERRPATIFGEQADDSIGYGWLDLVQTDLEAAAYAVGKIVLGTCSVGGADIRQRLYFVAESESARGGPGLCDCWQGGQRGHQHSDRGVLGGLGDPERERLQERECGRRVPDQATARDARAQPERGSDPGGMEHTDLPGSARLGADGGKDTGARGLRPGSADSGGAGGLASTDGREPGHRELQRSGEHGPEPEDVGVVRLEDSGRRGLDPRSSSGPGCESGDALTEHRGELCGVDNSAGARCDGPLEDPERDSRNEARLRMSGAGRGESGNFADRGTGPLKGFWRDCDWIHCRPERGYPNGRWRPVESGTFPLAHGDPCRLGRLRLYGAAINVEVATAFIRAYLEATEGE